MARTHPIKTITELCQKARVAQSESVECRKLAVATALHSMNVDTSGAVFAIHARPDSDVVRVFSKARPTSKIWEPVGSLHLGTAKFDLTDAAPVPTFEPGYGLEVIDDKAMCDALALELSIACDKEVA